MNLLQGTPDHETQSALVSAGSGTYFEVNEYAAGDQRERPTSAALGPIAYVRMTELPASAGEREGATGSTTTLHRRMGPNSEVFLIDGGTPQDNYATSRSQ